MEPETSEKQPVPAAPQSGGLKTCPVCGKTGFLGFANRPEAQYCADHMPGLSEQDRQLYRAANQPR